MCNPVLLASGLATGAGIMMQNSSANKAKRKRTEYVTAESGRQKAFQEEGQGAMLASNAMMDRAGGFDAGVAKEAAGLGNYYGGRLANSLNLPSAAKGAPQIVADSFADAKNKAAGRDAQQDQALADLNSFGTYLTNRINPQFSNSANTNALAGNFMQGSTTALDSELESANQLAYNPLAQLLIAGGQVGTSYGLKA